MNNALGLAYCILSTIFFGLYAVPKQYTLASLRPFLFWMGIGVLITSAVICPAIETVTNIAPLHFALMFGSGIVWSIGTLGYITSIQHIGLTRSTPIKNVNGALGTIFGITIFHEFVIDRPTSLSLVIIGSITVVISAVLLGRLGPTDDDSDRSVNTHDLCLGIFWASIAAIGFSLYSIPMKFVFNQGVEPATFLFYMAQGCFIGNAVIASLLPRQPEGTILHTRDYALCLLSGSIWAIASIFANLSVKLIGITISWPITNLNTIVAVAYGIIILHEIKVSEHKLTFWLGIVTTIIGIGLLAAAMETD